ncbi:MAG: hypothetical protein JWL76_2166 [Thermoleophilia bacterium]|nr:hypothetical protein [Thermoleophilia bacterium]
MNTQLFGAPNTGGSFADKLKTATDFLNGARGQATAPVVDAEPVTHGLAVAEAPVADVAPGAAAPTGVDAAASVTTAAGHDADGLAAAARAAAEQSIADPAYTAGAQQQVEVIVQPRVMVQGQQGPIIVPVDVAVPAAQTRVTIAPAQSVMLDPATGQIVAAPAAAQAAAPAAQVAEAGAPTTRGFRSWGIEDLANIGRGRNAAAAPAAAAPAAAAPAATAATTVAADAPAAAGGGGWRAQINDAIIAARGGTPVAATAAPAATVAAEAAPAPVAAAGRGWRSAIEDALHLPKAPGGAAPAAEAVVADAPAAVIASGGGWRSKVEDALGLAKAGGASRAAATTEVAAEAKPGLLATIRENTAGIGALLTRGGEAAPAVGAAAEGVAKAVRPGLGAELRAAAEAAKLIR